MKKFLDFKNFNFKWNKEALLLSYWPGFYALLSSGPLPAVRQAAAGKPPEAVWLLRLRTGGMFRPILPRRR